MSRFVDRSATDEITLANGDKVQVRQRLTAPEAAALKRNLFRLRMNATTGRIETDEGDWHLQRINVVKAYVVSWGFCDDAGAPVAYSPEVVDSLDEETIGEIAAAIDQLQAERAIGREKKGAS